MERTEARAFNRQEIEEMTQRKANKETSFFWSEVTKNAAARPQESRKSLSSEDEHTLFSKHSEGQGTIEDLIPVEKSGPKSDEINAILTFDELRGDIPSFIMRNLGLMKFERPTPIQKHSIPLGLAGLDLMCCAQTGSGKTIAFLLPVITVLSLPFPRPAINSHDVSESLIETSDTESCGKIAEISIFAAPTRKRIDLERGVFPRGIILSPTRELASQIHLDSRKLCHGSDIKSICVYGGVDIRPQLIELSSGCDLIVATPGRLSDLLDRGIISLSQVEILVLDEADRMLDMGFEPQIRRIVLEGDMPRKEDRQTFLFSATFAPEIQALAKAFLREYVWIGVGRTGSTVDNIQQNIVLASSNPMHKIQLLYEAVRKTDGRTLVFVQRKRTATWVCQCLTSQLRVAADEIHGDKSQSQREQALKNFRSGRIQILVATDVAARGLDIPLVTHVIQYDLPASPEEFDTYVHRIGRTGRAGKEGIATSFFVPGREAGEGNGKIAPLILRLLQENSQEIPEWFLALKETNASISSIMEEASAGRRPTHSSGATAGATGHSSSSSSVAAAGPRTGAANYASRDIRTGYQSHVYYGSSYPPGTVYPGGTAVPAGGAAAMATAGGVVYGQQQQQMGQQAFGYATAQGYSAVQYQAQQQYGSHPQQAQVQQRYYKPQQQSQQFHQPQNHQQYPQQHQQFLQQQQQRQQQVQYHQQERSQNGGSAFMIQPQLRSPSFRGGIDKSMSDTAIQTPTDAASAPSRSGTEDQRSSQETDKTLPHAAAAPQSSNEVDEVVGDAEIQAGEVSMSSAVAALSLLSTPQAPPLNISPASASSGTTASVAGSTVVRATAGVTEAPAPPAATAPPVPTAAAAAGTTTATVKAGLVQIGKSAGVGNSPLAHVPLPPVLSPPVMTVPGAGPLVAAPGVDPATLIEFHKVVNRVRSGSDSSSSAGGLAAGPPGGHRQQQTLHYHQQHQQQHQFAHQQQHQSAHQQHYNPHQHQKQYAHPAGAAYGQYQGQGNAKRGVGPGPGPGSFYGQERTYLGVDNVHQQFGGQGGHASRNQAVGPGGGRPYQHDGRISAAGSPYTRPYTGNASQLPAGSSGQRGFDLQQPHHQQHQQQHQQQYQQQQQPHQQSYQQRQQPQHQLTYQTNFTPTGGGLYAAPAVGGASTAAVYGGQAYMTGPPGTTMSPQAYVPAYYPAQQLPVGQYSYQGQQSSQVGPYNTGGSQAGPYYTGGGEAGPFNIGVGQLMAPTMVTPQIPQEGGTGASQLSIATAGAILPGTLHQPILPPSTPPPPQQQTYVAVDSSVVGPGMMPYPAAAYPAGTMAYPQTGNYVYMTTPQAYSPAYMYMSHPSAQQTPSGHVSYTSGPVDIVTQGDYNGAEGAIGEDGGGSGSGSGSGMGGAAPNTAFRQMEQHNQQQRDHLQIAQSQAQPQLQVQGQSESSLALQQQTPTASSEAPVVVEEQSLSPGSSPAPPSSTADNSES